MLLFHMNLTVEIISWNLSIHTNAEAEELVIAL